jgi:hypothetical protein
MTKKIRNKGQIKTILEFNHQVTEFHETDNLHIKTLEESTNNYESAFITIRQVMEQNEQYCCDDEDDRLSLAQIITDSLNKSLLIRKE